MKKRVIVRQGVTPEETRMLFQGEYQVTPGVEIEVSFDWGEEDQALDLFDKFAAKARAQIMDRA